MSSSKIYIEVTRNYAKEQEVIKGVIYNKENKQFVLSTSYNYVINRAIIYYTPFPDKAMLISKNSWERSIYCKRTKFSFRAHAPANIKQLKQEPEK